jgi:YVTN family beta-propeller protein
MTHLRSSYANSFTLTPPPGGGLYSRDRITTGDTMRRIVAVNAGLLALLLGLAASAFAGSVITIPVGTVPKFVAINQTTNVIYVSNLTSNNVSVIDGATNAVIATVPVGTAPAGLDVNSTTNMVYVVNSEGNSVSVIDGSTNVVTATITGMSNPYSLAVNSATNQVFVANRRKQCLGDRRRDQQRYCDGSSWQGPMGSIGQLHRESDLCGEFVGCNALCD